jgi:hypothetical protein
MSKYIKPTISLVGNAGIATVSASCSTSTTDAQMIKQILQMMGYSEADYSQAFGANEPCVIKVEIEGYCKFSSAIQVFNS